ncbi:MAG: glycosyltransferase family 4 protein [Patescibacteria group bacterium]
MKILIATGIYPPDIGGPATFSRELAREAKRLGHTPTVLCYADAASVKGEGWEVRTVTRQGGAALRYLRYAFACFSLARRSDVVFLQGSVSEGLPGTLAAILARKPRLMKIVGDYAWEIYRQSGGKNLELLDEFVRRRHAGKIGRLEKIERWSVKRAKSVIVPSRYLKKIVAAWGVSEEKIQVIYNTVRPFEVATPRDELRRKFGVEGKKVLFYVGRLVPWKNLDFIIEALRDLPQDCLLVIGGDGPCLEDWKKLAQERGVAERVRFLDRIEHAAAGEWFQAADVFILPSGYEGFSHVVVEAASVGLPSFVSDQGGNPETQELFPRLVTVLPYLDKVAWSKALLEIPPRGESIVSATFEAAAQAYLSAMQKICAS